MTAADCFRLVALAAIWGAAFIFMRVAALIARPSGVSEGPMLAWAVAAALGACCLYGVVGVLIRRFAAGVAPRAMAADNQLAAAVVLIPLLPFMPPLAVPSALVLANVVALALLASGVAFILYFRLIADVGATRALAGGVLILGGTVLVTRG